MFHWMMDETAEKLLFLRVDEHGDRDCWGRTIRIPSVQDVAKKVNNNYFYP